MYFFKILEGSVPSPFDCYLVIRSLKTLELRMQRHMSNALTIGKFLEKHPAIEKVFHPGLPSHPHHQVSENRLVKYSWKIMNNPNIRPTLNTPENIKQN